MAVTVSYKWLLAPKFADTVKKISNFGGFPSIKQSYNAARLVEQLESELKRAQVEWLKIKAKYQPLLGKTEEKSQETTEEYKKAQEDFTREMTELLSFTVTFDKRDLIKIEDIEKLGLSPAEILCISQVLDFSSIEDQEAKAKELSSHASELIAPQP
jgi:hypothetical protein